MGGFFHILYIFTKKNLKLLFKKKHNIFLFIMMPILIKLTVVYFNYSLDVANKLSYLPNPQEIGINKIPKCRVPDDCVSLGYFIVGKEEQWIHDIMRTVSVKNDLVWGKDVKSLLTTRNQTEIFDYTHQFRNKTQIAVIFCTSEWLINFDNYDLKIPCNFEKLDDKLIYYSIYYNMTLGFESPYFFKLNSTFPINHYLLSTKKAVDEAIIIEETQNPNFELQISSKSFPVIENLFYKNTDFMSSNGCFLFYLSIGFSFLLIISDLIEEKVRGIKLFLTVSGLSTSAHLSIWNLYNLFLSVFFSLLNCVVICWVHDLLIRNVPVWFWFIYFLLSVYSMNVFAIFINSISTKSSSGYMYAYGFLLFSFVFQSLLNNPNSLNAFYSDKPVSRIFRLFFEFYPGYNFIKIYSDLVFFSGSFFKLDQKMYVSGNQFQFHHIFQTYQKFTMRGNIVLPSIFNSFLLIIRNVLFLTFLTIVFEKVLKSNQGVSLGLRSIFGRNRTDQNNQSSFSKKHQSVVNEEKTVERILNEGGDNLKKSMIVKSISKTFNKGTLCKQTRTSALNDVSFHVKKGEILSILGQNGAGKTTLLNILTGYLSPDLGEAHILGIDLKTQLQQVRRTISLCPQNDIFWPELSIQEHLEIFGILKGFTSQRLDEGKIKRNSATSQFGRVNE